MKKTILLLTAALLVVLPCCLEDRPLLRSRLTILFTGDTLGEIEPCG